jgi:hypothetical protein
MQGLAIGGAIDSDVDFIDPLCPFENPTSMSVRIRKALPLAEF